MFVLFVRDQNASAAFYRRVLGIEPHLDVPGMTMFALPGCDLGLMPEQGIRRILGDWLPDPALARGAPRGELYLTVDEPGAYYDRALAAGARAVSEPAERDWGDLAAYCLDPDGHLLAFARPITRPGTTAP